MLVLSRKPQESIVFPNLGITLEIVRIAGGKVRVGIDAPADVAVLRGELVESSGKSDTADEVHAGAPAKSPEHQFRNRLHTARLGLKLLEKQLAAGLHQEAENTLGQTLSVFQQLDSALALATIRRETTGRRALLVEDDTNESQLLAGILRLSGYEVETVRDGLQALESLQDHRPDFVLLDMNMPRCDGPTTLASIRSHEDWRGMRVFAVTGCSQQDLGINGYEAGVERWFQKPVDPEALLNAMNAPVDSPCVSA